MQINDFPECGEDCIINMNNYKICLNQCDNGHITSNILLADIIKTQIIGESKVNCYNCKTNINKIYNRIFYKC